MDGLTDSMGMNLSKLLEIVEDRGSWRAAVLGVAKSQTRLGYLTPPTSRVWIRGGEYPSISKGLLFHDSTELAEQFLLNELGKFNYEPPNNTHKVPQITRSFLYCKLS